MYCVLVSYALVGISMATREERSLAWQMFKCRAVLANARAFQDLFWDVMKAKHGQAFATVAPQGRKGDGGNDGYLPSEKHYYQVYSPVEPKEKVTTAAKKLAKDFALLKRQWSSHGNCLKKYSFVFNDKYEGAPKDIELALNNLRKKHSDIAFSQYCCRDLETDFMSLSETHWSVILGAAVPDPSRLTNLDYGVLADVIRLIMRASVEDAETRIDLPPELDEKIRLNGLSRANAARIRNGALLTGHIEKYFESNTTFALMELRNHIVGHYEAAKKVIEGQPPSQTSKVDAVFSLFRRSLFPKNAVAATATAVDAVIGFFFEACDVFDPNAAKELPGASP